MTSDSPLARRLAAVAMALIAAVLLLGMRVLYLGAFSADRVTRAPPSWDLPAPRGSVWDRDGGPLAVQTYRYNVGVAANEVHDAAEVANALARATGRPADAILAEISDPTRQWVPIARELPAADGRWLADLDLPGVYAEAAPRRTYPLGPAAAHLTGFVNVEGVGYYGVEGQYDRELTGRPGRMAGNSGTEPRAYRPPTSGVDLVLTIDREIQVAAADALRDVVSRQSATGGTIIVMDPRTGAVLASTSLPSYDPASFLDVEPMTWLDPAVSGTYEPGSVVKAMTAAAALDSGAVGVDFAYEDGGTVRYAGLTIANWDRVAHGHVTLAELLQNSLNVGAVHLALETGPDRFYEYLTAFGFGVPTGVDLASENPGTLHRPMDEADWYEGNLATNSFGQGMASTPLQVIAAMSAIANDGAAMVPHVVGAIVRPSGEVENVEPRIARRVIAPATARLMRDLLASVVTENVTHAGVPGYTAAGKTGTSQIPSEGGYDPDLTIASFCGFLPTADPRVLILVKVDEPDVPRGSDVAAPVFRTVAKAAIAELGIPPDGSGTGEETGR